MKACLYEEVEETQLRHVCHDHKSEFLVLKTLSAKEDIKVPLSIILKEAFIRNDGV